MRDFLYSLAGPTCSVVMGVVAFVTASLIATSLNIYYDSMLATFFLGVAGGLAGALLGFALYKALSGGFFHPAKKVSFKKAQRLTL